MRQSIEREFTFPQLVRFTLPSIVMLVCMSLYTIVDGFFISRFAGPAALAASNLAYPLIGLIVAVGVMFATGGCAVAAVKLGQGKSAQANRDFTLITLTAAAVSAGIAAASLLNLDGIVRFLGADQETAQLCKDYLSIIMLFAPASALQMVFQNFLVAAGRPQLGLCFSIASGVLNLLLDYLFMVPLGMGIKGAAWGTVSGYLLSAAGGLLFFLLRRKGLRFAKPAASLKTLLKSCGNGSSEMVSNLSNSVTTLLFNFYMLRLAGSAGVAAVTAVLYCQFLMNSFFIGFSIGVAPVVSYHYGADDKPFLRRTLARCIWFVGTFSLLVFLLAYLCAGHISAAFFKGTPSVLDMAADGLRLFSVSFLFAGVNIFASALFTALENGRVSAAISFLRTLFFTVLGIVVLSRFFGLTGLWLAVPAAELLTVFAALLFSRLLKTKYHIF
ncbi:MAG: MATE family efflux transporter [Clostridiales bacterium]|nr:MATE family efflux transporter [Clostridiales bacterium]